MGRGGLGVWREYGGGPTGGASVSRNDNGDTGDLDGEEKTGNHRS